MTNPEQREKIARAAKFMRHDGLCAFIGGYGFCSCGMDDALAAIITLDPAPESAETKGIISNETLAYTPRSAPDVERDGLRDKISDVHLRVGLLQASKYDRAIWDDALGQIQGLLSDVATTLARSSGS